jgi:uncharacterized DUF497 family protein
MRYGWGENKRQDNLRKHGVDFAAIHSFTWDASIRWIDDREDYGEVREIAVGFIGVVLHTVVFTERGDDITWIISLRKANKRESEKYEREV